MQEHLSHAVRSRTVHVISIIAVLSLILGIYSNAGASAPHAKKVRIALFLPLIDNSYTHSNTLGVQQVAAKMGASVQVFDAGYNATKQLSEIQDATTSGNFNAFIVYAIDSVNVVPAVKAAVKKGIKVLGMDVVIGARHRKLAPCCGMSSMVGYTGTENGAGIGKMMVAACAKKHPCNFAFLIGNLKFTIDQDRWAAIQAIVKKHRNMHEVAFQTANYDETQGLNTTTNIIQAHPNLNMIATTGDQMVLGSIQALISGGKKVGSGGVEIVGNGLSVQAYAAMKKGEIFEDYADIPFTEGQITAKLAVEAARGKRVPKSVNMQNQVPPLPRKGAIITKKDLGHFRPQW